MLALEKLPAAQAKKLLSLMRDMAEAYSRKKTRGRR